MNPILLAVLAFVAVGAAGFAFIPALMGSGRADKRIKALQGDVRANRVTADATRTRETRRKELQQSLRAQTAALEKKKKTTLRDRIFQAGMKIKPAAYIRNSVIVGILVAALCFVLQLELLYCLVFGIAGGYLLPSMYLNNRRKAYRNNFLDELPNAVEAIVRGVKAGMPLNDSMRLVAKEAKEPIKSDFQRVVDQQSVGMTIQEAIVSLYERVPVAEVNFFIVVITVQAQAGGNLSEALTNLSRVLRNRKKMKAKVKAMSSEAKASAGIIGSLPIIVAVLVSLTTPGYLLPMIQTPIGNILLGVAALLMFMGGFIMNRMIQFDV
jgi:tight adherence protein B